MGLNERDYIGGHTKRARSPSRWTQLRFRCFLLLRSLRERVRRKT